MEEGGGSVYGVCRAGKDFFLFFTKKSKGGWLERDGMMSSSCKGFTGR